MQQVVILGGYNSLGQIIARQLLAGGMKVVVFGEKSDDNKISHANYSYFKGDVFNIYAVNRVITRESIVISVYSYYDLWKMMDLSDPVSNIIKSMDQVNAHRLIYFSYSDSGIVNHGLSSTGSIIRKLFTISYEDRMKRAIEENIKNCKLDFTLNTLDEEFLRHHSAPIKRDSLIAYYRMVADFIHKQLILGGDLERYKMHKYKPMQSPVLV